jgi:hypothetical protein
MRIGLVLLLLAGVAAADRPKLASVRARIVQISVVGAKVAVKFARGFDDGIDRTWTARLVDANGKPVAGGQCTLVMVTKATGTCHTSLTSAQVRELQIVLDPP